MSELKSMDLTIENFGKSQINQEIEEYINSDYFYEQLGRLKNIFEENEGFVILKLLNYIFGIIIEYYLMFEKKENFISDLNLIIYKQIEYFLSLDIYDIYYGYGTEPNYGTIVFNAFLEKIQKENIKIEEILNKRFIFHSFNASFYESIKENGFDIKQKKQMLKDMSILEEIGNSYGISRLYTVYDDFRYDEISYSQTPFVSYNYSQTSPEWFYFLTGEASCFISLRQGIKGSSFVEKDYDKCKNNLLCLMDSYNFNEKDKNIFLSIFNSYWEKFDNEYSYLAIIPQNQKKQEILKVDNSNIESVLYDYLFTGSNEYTNKKNDTSNAIFVKLPNINVIYKKLGIKRSDSRVK